jgi:putative membrane protein
MRTSRFRLLSAVALGISVAIQAQTAGNAQDPARAAVERADEAAREAFGQTEITDPTVFVKSAALGGMTAIELAKLAQSKSQDAQIRNFAARVFREQEALHRDLAAVAKRKRLDVPTSLVYQDEQRVNEAAEKPESQFDAWYAQEMVSESRRAIALFQAAARMEDAQLAAYARKALPVLESQEKTAVALANR